MYYLAKAQMIGGSDFIVTQDKLTWIPLDPANTDYQKYLAWVAEGNTPEEWKPDE